MTDNDNGERLNLKINDIVGIKLSLNPKNEYKVFLSDDSLFWVNQELFYDSINEEYRAVYKAVVAGKQNLVIHRCDDSQCAFSEEVFSVFITIK